MTDDVHKRFNAAFPWFDHARWAWSYDPVEHDQSHCYLVPNALPDASGDIATYMQGATKEQCDAVKQWLLREFNPKYEIPATHLLSKKMPVDHRHRQHMGRAAVRLPAWWRARGMRKLGLEPERNERGEVERPAQAASALTPRRPT